MPKKTKITMMKGTLVEARIGKLAPHTKPDGTLARNTRKEKVQGVILEAVDAQQFKVKFVNGKTIDMASSQL